MPVVDRVRLYKTSIAEEQAEPTIAGALDVASRFGLKPTEAKKILREVFTAVSGWRTPGKRLRLKAATLDAYANAFQHPLMDEARRILGR